MASEQAIQIFRQISNESRAVVNRVSLFCPKLPLFVYILILIWN